VRSAVGAVSKRRTGLEEQRREQRKGREDRVVLIACTEVPVTSAPRCAVLRARALCLRGSARLGVAPYRQARRRTANRKRNRSRLSQNEIPLHHRRAGVVAAPHRGVQLSWRHHGQPGYGGTDLFQYLRGSARTLVRNPPAPAHPSRLRPVRKTVCCCVRGRALQGRNV
jgi:hypothetical protein